MSLKNVLCWAFCGIIFLVWVKVKLHTYIDVGENDTKNQFRSGGTEVSATDMRGWREAFLCGVYFRIVVLQTYQDAVEFYATIVSHPPRFLFVAVCCLFVVAEKRAKEQTVVLNPFDTIDKQTDGAVVSDNHLVKTGRGQTSHHPTTNERLFRIQRQTKSKKE